jgi:hypothetical protein
MTGTEANYPWCFRSPVHPLLGMTHCTETPGHFPPSEAPPAAQQQIEGHPPLRDTLGKAVGAA